MRIIHTPLETTVKFSAGDLQSIGGPAKGCYVRYRGNLLDDYSTWLDKQVSLESVIDRLILLADESVATLH